MSYDNWITLEKVQGDLEAELIRGLLEAQDIPVLLSREGAGRAFGITVGPLGEVEIFVPKQFESEAKTIIGHYIKGDLNQMGGDET